MNHEQERILSRSSSGDRVPANHPLRAVKDMANRVMHELSRDFSKIGIPTGSPVIPPGKLMRALLLQILYSIRTEPLLMEQLDYNLLFRWFVGLSADEEVWDLSTFSKNLEQLLKTGIVGKFFAMIREQMRVRGLLPDEHFTVDWQLIQAPLSHGSIPPTSNESRRRTAGARRASTSEGLSHVRA